MRYPFIVKDLKFELRSITQETDTCIELLSIVFLKIFMLLFIQFFFR